MFRNTLYIFSRQVFCEHSSPLSLFHCMVTLSTLIITTFELKRFANQLLGYKIIVRIYIYREDGNNVFRGLYLNHRIYSTV